MNTSQYVRDPNSRALISQNVIIASMLRNLSEITKKLDDMESRLHTIEKSLEKNKSDSNQLHLVYSSSFEEE